MHGFVRLIPPDAPLDAREAQKVQLGALCLSGPQVADPACHLCVYQNRRLMQLQLRSSANYTISLPRAFALDAPSAA